MRIPSRAPEWARLAHKEQWRRDRAAAQTLRTAFPDVELIRIELNFEDPEAMAPAAQSHVMHPPARAFFEFRCPYAHCDGKIDLGSIVALIMRDSSQHAEGTLECSGVRARNSQVKETCGVRVKYTISAEYAQKVGGVES